MSLSRRDFLHLTALAVAAGISPRAMAKASPADLYQTRFDSSVRLLHFTDCHAQLQPVYFREPSVNLGLGNAYGRPPHVVGAPLLRHFGLTEDSVAAHAFTHMDFAEGARRLGRVGGFAHLATLIRMMREAAGPTATLLLDGGDTWQGSWTSLQTRGQDMVKASNLLGVDIMTGHWEFTYNQDEVRANIKASSAEFLSQNVRVKEDALFDGAEVYDEDSGHAFKPYTVREMAGAKRVAVIGQAFPYTPIANPQRFIPDWTFGIQQESLQDLVNHIRAQEKPDAVVLLSHNGMDVDVKLAGMVQGIDAILGGHTHDGVPHALEIKNSGGITLVTNAGSNGKFLGVLDLKLGARGVSGYEYRLLPVFANFLAAADDLTAHIEAVRAPHIEKLTEVLAYTDTLLYRRGNFNGTFDEIVCDALLQANDAQIALSPGFRWGTTVLPGEPILFENVADQTAMTYPETYVRDMRGEDLKLILEDVADNLFNPDPFFQQGGDMVRVGGLSYSIDPHAKIGQRIADLRLHDGNLIDANKSYRVAGWATVGSQSEGPPIWDQVSEHLRSERTVRVDKVSSPKLNNVTGNPGIDTAA
jgi:S-sulfosulfanyl-L-cysteine sulfohydrolase